MRRRARTSGYTVEARLFGGPPEWEWVATCQHRHDAKHIADIYNRLVVDGVRAWVARVRKVAL